MRIVLNIGEDAELRKEIRELIKKSLDGEGRVEADRAMREVAKERIASVSQLTLTTIFERALSDQEWEASRGHMASSLRLHLKAQFRELMRDEVRKMTDESLRELISLECRKMVAEAVVSEIKRLKDGHLLQAARDAVNQAMRLFGNNG